jgi:hypothetical protein
VGDRSAVTGPLLSGIGLLRSVLLAQRPANAAPKSWGATGSGHATP